MFADVLNVLGQGLLDVVEDSDVKQSRKDRLETAREIKQIAAVVMVASAVLTVIALMASSSVGGALGIAISGLCVFTLSLDVHQVGENLENAIMINVFGRISAITDKLLLKQIVKDTVVLHYFVDLA